MTEITSICKECKHRFRRIFMPMIDDDGDKTVVNDENILIIQSCLISGIDIDAEFTIECSGFEHKTEKEKEELSLFKCKK